MRPFLMSAGISPRGCSIPLQRRISDFGAERSGRCVVSALKEHYGIEVALYTAESITRRVARETVSFNLQQPAGCRPTTTQVTELDGSMVPIVEFAAPEDVSDPAAKADKRKRRRCQWNEIRVCTTREANSVTARYGVSFGGALEAGCMMHLTCQQYGMDETTHIHGIADGAAWIAEQYEKQFGVQSSFLIDFYHTSEYLAAAANVCATPGSKDEWLSQQKQNLRENDHAAVLDELLKYVEADDVAEEQAPVRKCVRYLSNRRKHLDYRGAIEKELPIGSGEVESAHRSLIQRRLKLPGAWWGRANASAVAQLRVTRANSQWNQFWNQKKHNAAA